MFTISYFKKNPSPSWGGGARAPGFEPGSKVLETSILPLNYARILKTGGKCKLFLEFFELIIE